MKSPVIEKQSRFCAADCLDLFISSLNILMHIERAYAGFTSSMNPVALVITHFQLYFHHKQYALTLL